MSHLEINRQLDELQLLVNTLDKDYDFAFENPKQRTEIDARLVTKLEDLHQIQDKLLTFNISGRKIKIYKHIILNSGYDWYLSKIVTKLEQEGKNIEDELVNIEIERDFYFLIIVDLVRRKYYEKVLKYNENQLQFVLPEEINESNIEAFKQELEFYFKDEQEKLFDDFKFYYINKKGEKKIMYGKTTNFTNLISNVTCSSWYPNELHKQYSATCIDDIKSKTNFKAYFLNYQATLIIEFVEIVPVKFLEIQPFSEDQDVWFSGDGAGDQIYWSDNGTNWNVLGTIPMDYGNGTSVVFFEEVNLKFIKFQAGDYGSSLGYLRVS